MLLETMAPTPSRWTLGLSTRATLLVEEEAEDPAGDAAGAAGGTMEEDARTGEDARA